MQESILQWCTRFLPCRSLTHVFSRWSCYLHGPSAAVPRGTYLVQLWRILGRLSYFLFFTVPCWSAMDQPCEGLVHRPSGTDIRGAVFASIVTFWKFNWQATAGGHNVVLIDRPSTVVVSALLIIGDNCRGIYIMVHCRTGTPFLSIIAPSL